MHRLAPIAPLALLGLALAVPSAADASTPIHVLMAQSTCVGGPGYVQAYEGPAADGTTNVQFVGRGLKPTGTWHGATGAFTGANVSASALTPTSEYVAGAGKLGVSGPTSATWGSSVGGGVFKSPGGKSLCDVFAGLSNNVMLAENSEATLLVKASGAGMGVAVDMITGSPGNTWRFEVSVKASGKIQRRTATVKIRHTGQVIPIKGIGRLGSFKQALVVATNTSTHHTFKLGLAKR